MTDVLFYHLEAHPLERVLPTLLERCRERQWRVVVEAGSEERRDALDQHLWTYRDDSFLPHGSERDDDPPLQPIYLTTGQENPNGATVRFFVDRAAPGDLTGYDRAVVLFDGNDADALADARRHWKDLKAAGHQPTYWQQDPDGRWLKKA
eukprot:gene29702-33454_t